MEFDTDLVFCKYFSGVNNFVKPLEILGSFDEITKIRIKPDLPKDLLLLFSEYVEFNLELRKENGVIKIPKTMDYIVGSNIDFVLIYPLVTKFKIHLEKGRFDKPIPIFDLFDNFLVGIEGKNIVLRCRIAQPYIKQSRVNPPFNFKGTSWFLERGHVIEIKRERKII
jgi:hypothetical protein